MKSLIIYSVHRSIIFVSVFPALSASWSIKLWLKKFPSIITLKKGSEEVQIDPRLEPQPDEQIISKNLPSCFFGTTLATRLIALRVDTLIVTGTTTSGCVRATVVDSLQYGFRTIIPRECVGDRAQAPHEANLFDMGMKYADVVPLREVMEYFNSFPIQK